MKKLSKALGVDRVNGRPELFETQSPILINTRSPMRFFQKTAAISSATMLPANVGPLLKGLRP
jgi:hypothetical protein